ncbi:unknown [Prevotella sp. CAG:873]|jgi:hypothetical protein|nr:unknown [Prevotella sp. CAG:873]
MTPEEEDRMIDDAFRDVLNGYLASNFGCLCQL